MMRRARIVQEEGYKGSRVFVVYAYPDDDSEEEIKLGWAADRETAKECILDRYLNGDRKKVRRR
jgi:hypothetical protein